MPLNDVSTTQRSGGKSGIPGGRRGATLGAAFLALSAPTVAQTKPSPPSPAQPSRIYLSNDDHTDYMWTTDADTYNAVFVDMLDYYLKLTDDTAKNPSQYEQRKSPAEFDRLMKRVKDGHISSPLNTLVSCYGAQPMEAVLRGMYYAGRLERRYNLRFPLAMAMEDQTLPLGLSSLWAGSGARLRQSDTQRRTRQAGQRDLLV